MPAKLEPPPKGATTMSGISPAFSICLTASSPMTVWCMSTWLSTLPRAYLVFSSEAARSMASEMAMPRLPGESGASARMLRPAAVRLVGEAWTLAPQVFIIIFR